MEPRRGDPVTIRRTVEIPLDHAALRGDLVVFEASRGVVVFAHGSGSGRHSPRNQHVAERLHRDGLATLLLDLLTDSEEAIDLRTGELRFDIGLLADRLVGAVSWLDQQGDLRHLDVGYFGASTGAAAALVAAARQGDRIAAVVSRGGRPDLAGDALRAVRAPTLLIVGGHDPSVFALNCQAEQLLPGERRVDVVPGATHLFEEPGALEHVADLAADWFTRHLTPAARSGHGVPR